MLLWRWVIAAVCVFPEAVLSQEGKDLGGGWQEKKKDGRVVQEMQIQAPSFTEEDQHGYNMPDMYKCSSCKAVMFHLNNDLHKIQPKSRRMKDWEYTELFDDTCRSSFDGYGVKLVDGQNVLGGPGLPQEDTLKPGMGAIQMGGETWGKRLGEICRKIIYEAIGEDETYELFYKKLKEVPSEDETVIGEPGLSASLCYSKIRYCELGPKLPKLEDAETAKKSEKPKKKKVPKKDKSATTSAKATPKVKAPASQKSAPVAPTSPSTGTSKDSIDIQTFLRSVAVKHGLTSDEYLQTRTQREWEKLIVAMAGRIFNKASDTTDGSCKA